MLQFIRDQATGWIAWVIVILICIPFALWGLNEFQGGATQQSVANVNGTDIGLYTYQRAYQTQRQQLQRIFGGQLPSVYNEERLRQDTLNQMVNDELIIQIGVNSGMRIGDQQLAETIQTLPLFNSETGFTTEQYMAFLQSRGLSAEGFEIDMRRSLLSQQLITGIRASSIVTKSTLEQALRLDNEKRRFVTLSVAPPAGDVPVANETQMQAYFEAHQDQYVVPEQVKIEYIELSRNAIADQISLDESELLKIYEESRDNFGTAEQRQVRHILVQVESGADDAASELAKQKILTIAERIKQGEDFAELAKTESDDPGSSANGGDLGFFGKNVMDPAFEASAFSLDKGQVSEPVRSSFGWHLIEVTGIQKGKIKSFEEVREVLLTNYRNDQADQIFAEQIDQLATIAYEQPESLQPAADALGIEVKQSEYFSRQGLAGNPILSDARVLTTAFTPELRSDGHNSELLELGADTVVVLRPLEHKESHPQKFADVRDQIATALRIEATKKQSATLGDAIVQTLESGVSREQTAQQHALKWTEEKHLTRKAIGEVSPKVLEKVFKMPKPADSSVRYSGLVDDDGGYTVIALLSVDVIGQGEEGAADKVQVEQTLASSLGEQAFSAVVNSIRDRSDVQTFAENITATERY